MRGVLTGFKDVLGAEPGPEVTGVLLLLFSDGFAVGTAVDFGRLRLGLAAAPELAGFFSLGREVKNAPRTSSSSCTGGAAVPITAAQRKTNAKTITLNRIEISF